MKKNDSNEAASRKIRVSYCTTCHGRLWQLALTLCDNLDRLKDDEEMVLVDYGSADGLSRYIESSSKCMEAIRGGKLVYVCTEARNHHCPKSKNLAHRIALGDFLVNLDADNSNLGMRRVINRYIADGFADTALHMVDGARNGTYGRIGLPRYWFYRLGGYDETFLPTAYHDVDILARAKAMGLRYVRKPTGAPLPVKNSVVDTVAKTGHLRNLSASGKGSNTQSSRDGLARQIQLYNHRTNQAASEKNLREGRLVANLTGWGAATVRVNFGNYIKLPPILPERITVVIRHSDAAANVNQILERYNRMSIVGEIFLINSLDVRTLEKSERSDSKVTVVNARGDSSVFSYLAVAAQATFPAVFLTDDQIFLPEPSLASLHKGWSSDPAILHGLIARSSERVRKQLIWSPQKILPVQGVLTTARHCFQTLCYASQFASEFSTATGAQDSDALLSCFVARESKRPNRGYRLPIEKADDRPGARICLRTPPSTSVVKWCRQHIVTESKTAVHPLRCSRKPVLFAGPWVGEFGWELCWWNPMIRSFADDYKRVIIAAPEGSRYLYEFADDFIPLKTSGEMFVKGQLLSDFPKPSAKWDVKHPSVLWNEFGFRELEAINGGRLPPTPKQWRQLAPGPAASRVADVLCAFRPEKVVENRLVAGKSYPEEKCAELVALFLKAGLSVGCFGGKENYGFENTVDLRGAPLEVQCGALSAAICALGPSSGPIHLASLCGCPHVTWSSVRPNVLALRYETYWNPFQIPVCFLQNDAPWPDEIHSKTMEFIQGLNPRPLHSGAV